MNPIHITILVVNIINMVLALGVLRYSLGVTSELKHAHKRIDALETVLRDHKHFVKL